MEEPLLIENGTLLQLSLDRIFDLQFLELMTPALRFLHIESCFALNGFTVISAPKLEDLILCVQQPLRIDDVYGHLSSVRTLKILLYSYGHLLYEDITNRNYNGIHLLQRCRLTRCLEVSLKVAEVCRMHASREYITHEMPKIFILSLTAMH